MKKIFKSFATAFSLYSKIPMPRFEWASEDMKYHLCFFPLVGAVIGIAEYFWWLTGIKNSAPVMYYIFSILIPVFITGGFHLDGFMDTMDAINSYQPKEKKLEILKDPHAGAFSVISIIVYFLTALAFVFETGNSADILTMGCVFVISRILSGLSVLYFPKAKKTGMAATENDTSSRKINGIILLLEFSAAVFFLIFFTVDESICGIVATALMVSVFLYYNIMSRKNFGGITGDLAGFFVCVSELICLAGTSVCSIFGV